MAWLFRWLRPRQSSDPMPDVGQPPEDAQPIAEPRLQDIGSGSYELPLPNDETDAEFDESDSSG